MMPNQKFSYRITNWSEYNKSLKQRGSLTIWLSEDFEENWLVVKQDKKVRGRPFLYSDSCMKLILALRYLFKLALRQLTGFAESLFALLGKILIMLSFCMSIFCKGKKIF